MEGFLWKFIRGAGLAYGANIAQDIESGTIYYRVGAAGSTTVFAISLNRLLPACRSTSRRIRTPPSPLLAIFSTTSFRAR
jgi:hypothetical protein